ncbi:hypothetical protein FDECE_9107 [Fusarium decemcellulare]|nr:hypothetical protein FDECE_9107 [Fusarium decemcellulare]
MLPFHAPVVALLNSSTGSRYQETRVPVDFLLKFTDSSPYGPSAAAIIEFTFDQFGSQDGTAGILIEPFSSKEDLAPTDGLLCGQADDFPSLFETVSCDFGVDISSPCQTLSRSNQPVLAQRASEMVIQLSMTYGLVMQEDPVSRVKFDIVAARSLFTEINLRQFVRAYFHQIHWYNPIIHRGTFDIETVSLPLLISIFLFGTLCCPSHDTALSARDFFDIAEEFIFRHPTFRRLLEDRSPRGNTVEDIQLLQAAYTIEIVQNGSNDTNTRRRLRLVRHPSLVAAMRISGLFGAKRKSSPQLSMYAVSDWQAFVLDETRVR